VLRRVLPRHSRRRAACLFCTSTERLGAIQRNACGVRKRPSSSVRTNGNHGPDRWFHHGITGRLSGFTLCSTRPSPPRCGHNALPKRLTANKRPTSYRGQPPIAAILFTPWLARNYPATGRKAWGVDDQFCDGVKPLIPNALRGMRVPHPQTLQTKAAKLRLCPPDIPDATALTT